MLTRGKEKKKEKKGKSQRKGGRRSRRGAEEGGRSEISCIYASAGAAPGADLSSG